MSDSSYYSNGSYSKSSNPIPKKTISPFTMIGNSAALHSYEKQNKASSVHVTQLLRKRVSGDNPHVQLSDIFYDKTDGEYYSGMNEKPGQKKIYLSQNELNRFQNFTRHKDRSVRTLPLAHASSESRSGPSIYAHSIDIRTWDPREESANGITVEEGNLIANPPPAVRLYAEGSMEHAAVLSQQMQNTIGVHGAGDDRGFLDLLSTPPVPGRIPLIKATEYERLNAIKTRVGLRPQGQFPPIDAMGMANLEASFGGNTGTFIKGAEKDTSIPRLYDLIQSTFFWDPDQNSQGNLNSLLDFMTTQHRKLKPNGKIRITLGNQDQYLHPNLGGRNNYRLVADTIVNHPRITPLYNMRLTVLAGQRNYPGTLTPENTYAEKLNTLGLNPFGNNGYHTFEHRRTLNNIAVNVWDDVILEGSVIPPPNPLVLLQQLLSMLNPPGPRIEDVD